MNGQGVVLVRVLDARADLRVPLGHQLHIGYGDFLRYIGRFSEAAAAYQRVLIFVPDDPDVRLALGGAYWSGGSRDRAVYEWGEILRRDPTFERARLALAQAGKSDR